MRNFMTRGMTAAFGLATVLGGAANAQQEANPAVSRALDNNDVPGPIDSLQDLQDTGKIAFKMADTNNDNQISQKEAIDAGNLLVGGFFFRADADGDGSISPEEAKAARDSLLQQKPLLRFVLERAKAANPNEAAQGTNAAKGLANLLDTNNNKKIEATELRQAVQTGVQGLYATADTNRDGQMSPAEVNAAILGAANAMATAAFQAADADKDGGLSKEEFMKAAQAPVNAAFAVFDANGDGKITPQEADNARRIVTAQFKQLMVPEPGNSARNLIETGRPANTVAPIPASPRQQ